MRKVKSIRTNAIYNMIRQCAAILFPMITFSYASHVLGSENIGAYSFTQSIVSYFSLCAALGISTYAIREGTFVRDERQRFTFFASELFSLNIITTIISFIGLIILLLFWSELSEYREQILVLSVSVFITTIGADWVNSVYEDFKYISIRYLVVQLTAFILLFVFVKNEFHLMRYTWVTLLAASGGGLLNIYYIRRYVKLKFTVHINIKKHLMPLLLFFGNNLAVLIYVNSDISIITIILGKEAAGIYTSATKIYQAVKHMMFAIVTVMIPRASYLISKKKYEQRDKLVSSTINYLMYLILPGITGLFMEGKNIIYIFSGEKFCGGASALQILCVAILFATMSNIFNGGVLLPEKEEKVVLKITIIASIVNVVLNLFFIKRVGIVGAAFTTLLAEMLNGLGSFYYAQKRLRIQINGADMLKESIGCIFIIAICLLIRVAKFAVGIEFILAVVCSGLIYFIVTYGLQNNISRQMVIEIKSKILKR